MRTPPFAEGSAEGRGALENKFLLPQGVKDCKCKNCKSFEFEASGTSAKKKKMEQLEVRKRWSFSDENKANAKSRIEY